MRIWAILILILLCGCATITSEGTVAPVAAFSNLPKEQKTITVFVYRSTVTHFDVSESTKIERSQGLSDIVAAGFRNSGAFSRVDVRGFSSDYINASSKDTTFTSDLVAKVLDGIQTDFYVVVVVGELRNIGEGPPAIVMLPAILTLGIIPFYRTIKISVVARFFKKGGAQVKEFSLDDEMKTWHWTPLLLSPKSQFMPTNHDGQNENVVRAVQHLLSDALVAGVFN